MADSSVIPVRRVEVARQDTAKPSAKEVDAQSLPSISPAGPRKLIRPPLPPDGARYPAQRTARVAASRSRPDAAMRGDSSHAEAYYLQKQIQSKTPMIFQLEDGERIAGVIEWYDLHVIKVRHGSTRTLIYKDGIKYLYKAAEADRVTGQP
jgi:sRNA-binding regulator protein Hfq